MGLVGRKDDIYDSHHKNLKVCVLFREEAGSFLFFFD